MNESTIPHEIDVPSVARYTGTPGLPAPAGHEFASLCWLVARHPGLAEVAARVPGAVDTDGDVMPWVLAAAITDLDEHHAARLAHDLARPLPTSTQTPEEYAARLSAWAADAPTADPTLAVVQDLTGAEVGQLRLLATFNRSGVRFGAGMLDGFDPGRALLGDWLTAVHHLNDIPTTPTAAVQDTATRDDTSTSTSADEDDDLDDDEAEVSAEEEYYSSIWWEDSDQDDLDTLDDVEEVTSRSSVQAEAGPGQLVIPARTASPTGVGVAGVGIDQDWWQRDTTTGSSPAEFAAGAYMAGADRDDGWSR